MNGIIDWCARNRVAANLVMVMIVAGGLLALTRLRQEITPEIDTEMVTVSVAYPGASPAEVEEGICIKIEEAVLGLEGVERVRSSAAENGGTVYIELEGGYDQKDLLDDVKAAVDRIDTFPEEAEEPVVAEAEFNPSVLSVAVWGVAGDKVLRRVADRLRDRLTQRPEISVVELRNAPPWEIAIEVSEAALRRYGLRFDEVAAAVRRSSMDLPGGAIRSAGGEILLRGKGQAYRGREFEDLVLRAFPDGTRLRLGDVARVVDGFAETDQESRFNGEPAVLVGVFRIGDQDALTIATAVREVLAEEQLRLPEGIHLTVFGDDTKILRDRLDLMIRNGRMGLLLVLLTLGLFLRPRLAFWVTLGIPTAFLGTFWLMPAMDVTVNLISLFAFILALGIVVDDAIVFGENVHSWRQRGADGLTAAIRGSQEVAVPVFFSVATTMAAFAPLLFVPGRMGQFASVLPKIVLATLAFSLVEALVVLPAHLVHLPAQGARRGLAALWSRVQDGVAWGLEFVVRRLYRPTLAFALEWRYLTLAVGLATLLLTAGWVGSGRMPFTFFPPVEADAVEVALTMPQGTPAEFTARHLRQLEDAARRLQAELREETGQEIIRSIITSVGDQPFRERQRMAGGGGLTQAYQGGHLGEVNLELLSAEERDISGAEVVRRWRQLAGTVPGAVELAYTATLVDSGADIDVRLSGTDTATLRRAAADLKARLATFRGVHDIADSFRAGKREVRLVAAPGGEALGLPLGEVARQVRQAFYGEEAQRVQRGRDEVKVMVRYPREERRSLGNLEELRIRTPDGAEVPVTTAAILHDERGFATIERVDRARAIHVTAEVDPALGNANEILAELRTTFLPELLERYPGLAWGMEGDQREQAKFLSHLARNFVLAVLAIFALLAVPLRSYVQPVIIMSAIPFGAVGAVWGHILLGMQLTMFSIIGLVALSGVVVNDSLVMVDFVNRARREGATISEAVREAGRRRFRPILLTSLTTFAGLTPLLLEKSLQAQFLIPMAVSLGFGVVFATFITLILVPCGYLILDDAGRGLRRLAITLRLQAYDGGSRQATAPSSS